MVRVGGWYKRRVQVLLMIIGFVVACVMNIDAIHVASALATQPGLRMTIANRAAAAAVAAKQAQTTTDAQKQAIAARNELRDSNLPIGWSGGRPVTDFLDGLLMILGWVVTAFAACFGAPFWFDLINKLVPLRSAGAKPLSAPEAPFGMGAALGVANLVRVDGTLAVPKQEPFRAALNDYEANSLSTAEILQIKRMLGVGNPGAEIPTLDQETRDAIRTKQKEMNWPISGELSAHWVNLLRTGGV